MVGATAGLGGLLLWGLSRRHGPFQFPSEQRVEWFTELGLKANVAESFIILDHQHLREERLIEHSLDVLRSISVRGSAVHSQVQCQLQVAFDVFVLRARRFELCSDFLQGTTDALLLAPEKIEWDRSGVVGLQELLALTLELFLLTLEVRLFALHLLATRAELLTDHRLDAQAEARIKLHPVVVVLELLLNFVDQDRPEIAYGALGVTARAVVVRVLHAGRRSGVLDQESLTALAAGLASPRGTHSVLRRARAPGAVSDLPGSERAPPLSGNQEVGLQPTCAIRTSVCLEEIEAV